MDKCFYCDNTAKVMRWSDMIGNPICGECMAEWDSDDRPPRFLEKPVPTLPMIIHWERAPLEEGGEPFLLGYPGHNGRVDEWETRT
jgi:hypothetical protein